MLKVSSLTGETKRKLAVEIKFSITERRTEIKTFQPFGGVIEDWILCSYDGDKFQDAGHLFGSNFWIILPRNSLSFTLLQLYFNEGSETIICMAVWIDISPCYHNPSAVNDKLQIDIS